MAASTRFAAFRGTLMKQYRILPAEAARHAAIA